MKTSISKKATLFLSLTSALLAGGLALAPTVASAADSSSIQVAQAEKPAVSLAPVIKQVLPTVVSIDVKGVQTVRQSAPQDLFQGLLPREFQDLLGRGFGGQVPQERQQNVRSQGSGVIVDAEKGYVVTNNHVVEGGQVFTVKLHDNRTYQAKVVGTDPDSDLAVLKLEGFSNLQAIKFANSDKAEVGDYVIALGNPFGLGLTATQGIVSASNRSISLNLYDNYIQTDASINSGNSGGALVDLNGNLVGINTAILSKSGGSVGIGFAIPSNIVKTIAEQIIANGKVSRGQVGILGNDITPEIVKSAKLPVTEGAFILSVQPNSAAERAGLKGGDVITQINDTKIVDFQQVRALIGSLPADTKIKVTYLRDGKYNTVEVTVEPRAGATASSNANGVPPTEVQAFDAVFVEGEKGGVVVSDVARNSTIARYGIKKGDRLVRVLDTNIANLAELNAALEKHANDSVMVLAFQRGNNVIYVTFNYK